MDEKQIKVQTQIIKQVKCGDVITILHPEGYDLITVEVEQISSVRFDDTVEIKTKDGLLIYNCYSRIKIYNQEN